MANRSTRHSPFPIRSLDNGGNDTRSDSAATFADREAQLLFHRDRHDQVHFHRDVVARHHHLGAFGQVHDAGHIGGAEVELRPVVGEERGVTTALLLGQDVGLGLNLVCGLTEPGLHSTWPRSTSSRLVPRSSAPMLSPAWPWSNSLRSISTPVTMVFWVSRRPTISISSPTLMTPRSTRPVTTVPRPEIENTSSTGIRNGWSIGRAG